MKLSATGLGTEAAVDQKVFNGWLQPMQPIDINGEMALTCVFFVYAKAACRDAGSVK